MSFSRFIQWVLLGLSTAVLIALTLAGIAKLYECCWLHHYNKVLYEQAAPPALPSAPESSFMQKLRRLDEMDPPGIAGVPEYSVRHLGGRHVWNTNTAQLWSGIWTQDATGWRVQLQFYKTNTPDACMGVQVGSTVVNSGVGFLPPPDRRFLRFELSDSNGTALHPKWRAAAPL